MQKINKWLISTLTVKLFFLSPSSLVFQSLYAWGLKRKILLEKSVKQLTFTLSCVLKMTWGHAVLIAVATQWARGKRDGFCFPVSFHLSPFSPLGMLVQVINSQLDETPPFSDLSLNLTKAITNSPSGIKSGQWGRWLGDHHHEAHRGAQGWPGHQPVDALTRPDPLITMGWHPSLASACPSLCSQGDAFWPGLPWCPPAALLQGRRPLSLHMGTPMGQREAEPNGHAFIFGSAELFCPIPHAHAEWQVSAIPVQGNALLGQQHFLRDKGCRPRITLKRLQCQCQGSTSVFSVQKSKPLHRPAWKWSHFSFYSTFFKHNMWCPRKDWAFSTLHLFLWGCANLCQTRKFLPVTWPLMVPVLKVPL